MARNKVKRSPIMFVAYIEKTTPPRGEISHQKGAEAASQVGEGGKPPSPPSSKWISPGGKLGIGGSNPSLQSRASLPGWSTCCWGGGGGGVRVVLYRPSQSCSLGHILF